MSRQIKDIKDFNTGELVYPRTHVSAVVGLENFSGGGSSEANVKAVDTGDVLDDVAVNYATIEYVDSILGDINSILESIINSSPNIITFTIMDIEYQAEEGMTWGEWVDSKYNTTDFYLSTRFSILYGEGESVHDGGYAVISGDIILENHVYQLLHEGGGH